MNLFISNSKMKKRTKNLVVILLFCAVFISLFALGYAFTKGKYVGPYLMIDDKLSSLLSEEVYIDFGLGINSLSHDIFYHNFGKSVQEARKADVLILGNSRTLCGFSMELMRSFAEENDIRFYNMAFGFNESVAFPTYIMEKYKLRPKVVIVNANHFFVNEASAYGEGLLRRSSWAQFRSWLDDYTKYLNFRVWRKYMPHFFPDFRVVGDYAFVRSEEDGFWTVWNLKKPSITFAASKTESFDRQIAREFRDFVQSWGGTLILTYVPNPKLDGASIRKLARELDVDLIYPEIQDLRTFDGSHLAPESGRKFTKVFLEEFKSLLK